MKYCAFCDNAADYIIENTDTPICDACKGVYVCGQSNHTATFKEVKD